MNQYSPAFQEAYADEYADFLRLFDVPSSVTLIVTEADDTTRGWGHCYHFSFESGILADLSLQPVETSKGLGDRLREAAQIAQRYNVELSIRINLKGG